MLKTRKNKATNPDLLPKQAARFIGAAEAKRKQSEKT
jgi:hypothetical protein